MADLTLAALTAQLFTGLVLGMILVLLAVAPAAVFARRLANQPGDGTAARGV